MSDYGKGIQRIAQTEELQRQINDLLSQVQDLKDKSAKLGDRSTAYKSASGGIGQKSSDKDAEMIEEDVGSALDDFTDGLLDVFSDEAGTDVGTGDLTTPNQLDSFSQDLNDLATTPPKEGSSLFQLTGLEEVGGDKEATVNLDGMFPPEIYGNPDWTEYNADIDPRMEDFISGQQYQAQQLGYTAPFSPSSYSAAELGIAGLASPFSGVYGPFTFTLGGDNGFGVRPMTIHGFDITGLIPNSTTANVTRFACTPGSSDACPLEQPTDLEWAMDGIHKLAFTGARFLTHDNEAAVDLLNSWSDGPSKLTGETSGGVGVTIEPTDTGGSNITFSNGNQIEVGRDGTVLQTNYI